MQFKQGWQPAFTPDNNRIKLARTILPKVAFTIFLLFSSTKTVLSILYVYK